MQHLTSTITTILFVRALVVTLCMLVKAAISLTDTENFTQGTYICVHTICYRVVLGCAYVCHVCSNTYKRTHICAHYTSHSAMLNSINIMVAL